MKSYAVYCHQNKTNGKMYIGITSQKPSRRWRNGSGYTDNIHFYNSITKYGWDGFEHIIIAEHLTEDEAKNFEIVLIDKLNTRDTDFGYNQTLGGDLSSPEVIEKMRKTKIGKNLHMNINKILANQLKVKTILGMENTGVVKKNKKLAIL